MARKAADIDMAFLVTVAAKGGGSQGQVLHYGLYGVLVLVGGVLLWVAQQFFGAMITRLGSKSADSVLTGFARHGRIAGGRLRKYQRAIQRNYAGHALGFGGTEVIEIRSVYVPLRYEEAGRREDIYARIRDERRSVVVGPAGAGKSLLLKNSMLIWADNSRMRPWHRGDRRLPVLVELHRCNDGDADIAQLVLDELDRNEVKRPKSFVERALRDGRLRLLLDGLDEVGKDRQERVVTMIRDFVRANPECQIVVTCRDAVYYGQLSPEFQHVVRIAEFDDASIRRMLGNWPGIDRQDVDNLVGTLRANPQLMHLARSPLLLTMIAYLYVSKFAKSGRSLPSSRVTFYETAIAHLLGRDQALARAAALSTYDVGDKLAALQRIALAMQENAVSDTADRREISQVAAIAASRSVLPDLNLDDSKAKPLFMEIVDRSQLLISLDQQRSHYSFRHLTLQEFLAARELADRPDDLLHGYMADPDGWREVVKLWCGVTTRNSTVVVREVLAFGSLRHQVLALECLAEAKYIDDAFAREVIDHFMVMLGTTSSTGQVLVTGFGALAAAEGPRGRSVLRRLIELTHPTSPSVDDDIRRAAISALCASGRQEAAEVLARLAPRDETARTALRAMGELAIPVLELQAAVGDTQAIDDLAFIGTPAAAESLASLLRINETADELRMRIPVTAAWRLAELLTVPDVEEGLKNSRFQVSEDVPSYDWVWKPFALPGTQDGSIGWIVGRAALLIDLNPTVVPQVAHDIDQRIAIPLVGIMAGARVKAQRSRVYPAGMHNRVEAEAYFLSESRSQSPVTPQGGELASETVRALNLPSAHEALMLRLPWPVLARLLAATFTDRIGATNFRDWLEVQQNPGSTRWLWRAVWTFASLTVPSAVFATFWQIEVMRGVAHLGMPWLYILVFCIFAGGLSALLFGFTALTFDREEDFIFITLIFAIIALPVAGVLDVAVSGLVLSRWIGPAVVAPLFAGVTGFTVLLTWLANRRERRSGNPLRHCVLASDRAFADRTSVLAK
jgi:energy-coupling factor transporter ATP-binding protein EcfA2